MKEGISRSLEIGSMVWLSRQKIRQYFREMAHRVYFLKLLYNLSKFTVLYKVRGWKNKLQAHVIIYFSIDNYVSLLKLCFLLNEGTLPHGFSTICNLKPTSDC